MLAEKELIYHLRKMSKDLEFLNDLPFEKFWAYMTKLHVFIDNMDSFLQNVRKYNDLGKVSIDLDQRFRESKLSSSGFEVQMELKSQTNSVLCVVLKLFHRLSTNMESGQKYFTMDLWRTVIYDHQLFDVAKLIDLAAVYGHSNNPLVTQIITNVFEFEPKLLNEFKEAFDMMLNIMKRIFKDALRTDQMVNGDVLLQKSRSEQDEVILRFMNNLLEMLTNFQLITNHFGDQAIEQVANTSFLVYVTNSYCLLRKVGKMWTPGCQSKESSTRIKQTVSIALKLCIQIASEVIGKGIVGKINVHSKNYAIV